MVLVGFVRLEICFCTGSVHSNKSSSVSSKILNLKSLLHPL